MNTPARFHLVTGSPDALPPLEDVQTPMRRRRKARKPRARCVGPAPAPLRPIAWGKRDEILGPAVCLWIEAAMPATPWEYTPQRKGWLSTLAGLFS